MEKSQKVLFDSKNFTFSSSLNSFPTLNEEKLWDKIKELVGEHKYLKHVVEQKDIILSEEKRLDQNIRLRYSAEMSTTTITHWKIDWYVVVYYE